MGNISTSLSHSQQLGIRQSLGETFAKYYDFTIVPGQQHYDMMLTIKEIPNAKMWTLNKENLNSYFGYDQGLTSFFFFRFFVLPVFLVHWPTTFVIPPELHWVQFGEYLLDQYESATMSALELTRMNSLLSIAHVSHYNM